MKISWKNIGNWQSWKTRFFWLGHFKFLKSSIWFFFYFISVKNPALLYELTFFSALWMVFPESWKISCPNFYAHDCIIFLYSLTFIIYVIQRFDQVKILGLIKILPKYDLNDLSLHGSEKANTQLTCHYWGLSIKWHAAPACNQGCFVLTQNYWLNWTLWLSLPTACWRPTPYARLYCTMPPYRAGCTKLSTNCCYRNDNHLFTAKK